MYVYIHIYIYIYIYIYVYGLFVRVGGCYLSTPPACTRRQSGRQARPLDRELSLSSSLSSLELRESGRQARRTPGTGYYRPLGIGLL